MIDHSDDDLYEFEKVEMVVVAMRFYDEKLNVYFGGLQMDGRDFDRARGQKNCPQDKQSFEYYAYLQDQADAVPCSPDNYGAPLVRKSPEGWTNAVWLYGVNAAGVMDLHNAHVSEVEAWARNSLTHDKPGDGRTYYLEPLVWSLHLHATQRLLTEGTAPR